MHFTRATSLLIAALAGIQTTLAAPVRIERRKINDVITGDIIAAISPAQRLAMSAWDAPSTTTDLQAIVHNITIFQNQMILVASDISKSEKKIKTAPVSIKGKPKTVDIDPSIDSIQSHLS